MPAPEDTKDISNKAFTGEMTERFASISEDLQAVKQTIRAQLVTGSKDVDDRLQYVASATGKLVRPALVLLCGRSCGTGKGELIEIGSIIEMIHVATLLHDDVIDHGDSRRNVATPNSIWGNESAVLLGDFLLSKAFALSSRLEDARVSRILADSAITICTGELQQNVQRDNWRLSEEDYFRIIEAKTASLFGASCGLGALAAGADEKTVQSYTTFGECLGIAFQVADDLIDITGIEKGEGKTLGRDLAEKKPTLPVIHLINKLDADKAEKFVESISSGSIPDDYQQMLDAAGSLEYSRTVVRDYCDRAVRCLEGIEQSEARDMLADIVEIVMERAVSD